MFTNLLKEFRGFLQNDLLYTLIIACCIVVGMYFLAALLKLITKKVVLPFTKKTESKFDDEIVEVISSAVYRLVFLSGFYFSTKLFRGNFKLYQSKVGGTLLTSYPHLDEIVLVAEYIIFVIFILIVLSSLFKVITIVFDWYAEKINAFENKDLSGSLFPLLKKISKIILAALAVVVILSKFKIDISGFIVSLGVGSLAIALAAQETISNMISGFIVMVDRPFRIGDRIRIGTDLVGDVLEIGIRSTKILDFDRNIIIVPNNDVVKSRIINLSYPSNVTRVLIEVGVAYGSDVDKVKSILMDAAVSHDKTSKEFPPEVAFIRFGESSIDFRLDVKTDIYKDAFILGSDLREIIYKKFNENKVEIPFPQRVVYVKN